MYCSERVVCGYGGIKSPFLPSSSELWAESLPLSVEKPVLPHRLTNLGRPWLSSPAVQRKPVSKADTKRGLSPPLFAYRASSSSSRALQHQVPVVTVQYCNNSHRGPSRPTVQIPLSFRHQYAHAGLPLGPGPLPVAQLQRFASSSPPRRGVPQVVFSPASTKSPRHPRRWQ